jgi:hypothetical protein
MDSKSIVKDAPVWFITGCSSGFGLELVRHPSNTAVERWRRRVNRPSWKATGQ